MTKGAVKILKAPLSLFVNYIIHFSLKQTNISDPVCLPRLEKARACKATQVQANIIFEDTDKNGPFLLNL
jgi:hypothetical protein